MLWFENYFYRKHPGAVITLRVPEQEGYSDELLKFQSEEEYYIEQEFESAVIVSCPLAQEEGAIYILF